MFKPLLVAVLLAAPATAFAQANTTTGSTSAATPSPTGNLNNPQMQSNQAGQPANARTTPGTGDATAIPTPVLGGHSMTDVTKPQAPPK